MGWQKQGALGLITEKTVAAELADTPQVSEQVN